MQIRKQGGFSQEHDKTENVWNKGLSQIKAHLIGEFTRAILYL